jgi:hypothetical protein
VEDTMVNTKAFTKMVICTGASIDLIRKYLIPDIPKAYYNLVKAFYYSLLRECYETVSEENDSGILV